jgi:uncharacterized protein YrrD
MLRRTQELIGYTVQATDGDVGHVDDLLFDDYDWRVRYFIVDTGSWLAHHRVLIAPECECIGRADTPKELLQVELSKSQVESSPKADLAKPLSQEYLEELHDHYGWSKAPTYGTVEPGQTRRTTPSFGDSAVGWHGVPSLAGWKPVQRESHETAELDKTDHRPIITPYLYSVDEIIGYRIRATDQLIGRVEDLLLDEGEWILRYLIVDTRRWLPGKDVIVGLEQVKSIDPYETDVHVSLTSDQLENAPEYNPQEPIGRDYEIKLYHYYGTPGYWE